MLSSLLVLVLVKLVLILILILVLMPSHPRLGVLGLRLGSELQVLIGLDAVGADLGLICGSDRDKVRQRGSGAESRARTVKAKFQSNSESERAKVSQRDFPQTFPFD